MWNNFKSRRHFCDVYIFKRKYTTTTSLGTDNKKVKKFEDIPGPKGLFGLGNFINYLPIIGN